MPLILTLDARPFGNARRCIALSSVLVLHSLWGQSIDVSRAGREGIVEDPSEWPEFKSRRGWSIKHPAGIRIASCRQCADAREGNIVSFETATGKTVLLVETLVPKPSNVASAAWLDKLANDVGGPPFLRKEWTFVDGRIALRTTSASDALGQWQQLFIIGRQNTYLIAMTDTDDAASTTIYRQMISTFRLW